MKSVMKHRFSNVPDVEIPRSSFNRSHGLKTTFDAGFLVPVFLDEALPGDTFNLRMSAFTRLTTPFYPVMDNMFLDTFFFAVPYRLIWDHWQNFCGERYPDPDSSIDYVIPIIDDAGNMSSQTLWDYFGLPIKVTDVFDVSALPFRAYNLIWNEFFRDQNLQDSLPFGGLNNRDDGPDTIANYSVLRRGKRHDYFTSCLPWLQKGEAVELSLGNDVPVYGIGVAGGFATGPLTPVYETNGTGADTYASYTGSAVYPNVVVEEDPNNTGYPNIWADLSGATVTTVNEMRMAFQVQRILERDSRAGSRYTEIIESHFGVHSDDARLQRPEYLGGGTSPVMLHPVARTDSQPGILGAIGVSGLNGHGFTKSFTEHCLVIGLANVRADLTYQEGVDRMWSRETRYDFFWPSFANLGEQAVLNKEIYIDHTTIADGSMDDVFGYQERYAEYRYKPSRICGKFRSTDTLPLDAWHLGIEFGSQPTLDDTFIQDNPPVDRVIRVPTEPHFLMDAYFNFECVRPMPVYSVPGNIDRF
jgi:hypothetical protein